MNSLTSIEEQWQGFAAVVFRNTKPAPNQEAEMKKAFFAGAWALFCALEEIGMPHVSEAEGTAYLEARRQECKAFQRQMTVDFAERN